MGGDLTVVTEHFGDDLIAVGVGGGVVTNETPIPHHQDSVGEGKDFCEPVRDEETTGAAVPIGAEPFEQALRFDAVSAAVGSSRIRTPALADKARAIITSCWWARSRRPMPLVAITSTPKSGRILVGLVLEHFPVDQPETCRFPVEHEASGRR